jgi:hypothetical protein
MITIGDVLLMATDITLEVVGTREQDFEDVSMLGDW